MARIESGSNVPRERIGTEAGKGSPAAGAKKATRAAREVKDPATPNDSFGRAATTRGPRTAAGKGDAPAQGNPFAALIAGATTPPPIRILGQGVGLERDLSPDTAAAAGLNAIDGAALTSGAADQLGEIAGATGKVRTGFMLTASDGAELQTSSSGANKDDIGELASAVAALKSEAAAQAGLHKALIARQGSFPLGMDINAFVQAVLRESYLIQTENLRDYAEKVKAFNEIKKQIRAKKSEAYGKPKGFDYATFKPETGEWVPWVPSEELVEEYAAKARTKSEADAGGDDGAESTTTTTTTTTTSAASTGTERPGTTVTWVVANPHAQFDKPAATPVEIGILKHALDGYGYGYTDEGPNDYEALFQPILSSIGGVENLNAAAAHAPLLTPKQYDTFVFALTMYMEGGFPGNKNLGKNKKHGDPALYDTLKAFLDHGTAAQLRALRECGSGSWGYASILTGNMGLTMVPYAKRQVEAESALAAYNDNNPSASQAPQWKLAVREFTDWQAHGRGSPEQLYNAVRQLPAALLPAFINLVSSQAPEVADQVLQMCDRQEVIKSSPNDWAFLQDVGPAAAHFFASWASALVDKGASGVGATSSDAKARDAKGTDTDKKPPERESEAEARARLFADTEVFKAYIASLDDSLNSVGDDAQLANVDLQNALQQQQQTLQMMSNISKMLHDTALSIIRKMGG